MAEAKGPATKPVSNRDFDFFYQGLADGALLVQQCDGCGALRCPPGPSCPECRSFAWTALPLGGTGRIFSYTVHHHPPLAGFATPLPVALVEMDEAIRMVGPMDDTAPDRLRIGARIATRFVERDGVAGFRFVLADA
ncbi:protein of unknown function DUF35 [Rhizorhabdus wittichii RW1]|uniref:DNA-binding protein n=1 Tax=Rhizorhabdus wittichii (strain DSM 6014 / CCUG 31198 / JCM 15750 / NBRC 105917 / EY 4224 / RW1) TaxID=392499 RepID=A0A9J9LDQ6_RHIWR|nr:protein of unknown function DUF35 [Rhizorhabdus wittichii RW1]